MITLVNKLKPISNNKLSSTVSFILNNLYTSQKDIHKNLELKFKSNANETKNQDILFDIKSDEELQGHWR